MALCNWEQFVTLGEPLTSFRPSHKGWNCGFAWRTGRRALHHRVVPTRTSFRSLTFLRRKTISPDDESTNRSPVLYAHRGNHDTLGKPSVFPLHSPADPHAAIPSDPFPEHPPRALCADSILFLGPLPPFSTRGKWSSLALHNGSETRNYDGHTLA